MVDTLSQARWRLSGARAELSVGRYTAYAEITRPDLGWKVEVAGRPLAGDFWQVRLPWLRRMQPEECYIRGQDLIVTYPLHPDRRVQPQAYWRVVGGGSADTLSLELILSMQTDRLDSDPRVLVRTSLEASAWWHLDSAERLRPLCSRAMVLDRSHGKPVLAAMTNFGFYVEMVYPGDFHQARLACVRGMARVSWRLFPESLEKGVIRRTRLRGVFSTTPLPETDVAELYRAFCSEPPPLTV